MLLLSIALLPLGLISISQTQNLSKEVKERAELSLLALTQRSASDERQTIERAFGSAQAIGQSIRSKRDDPAACSTYMHDYLTQSPGYSFVGFLPPDGMMVCSSTKRPYNFSNDDNFDMRMQTPVPFVDANLTAPLSQTSVLIIGWPVYERSIFQGYISISIPHEQIIHNDEAIDAREPIDLITINDQGKILTSELGLQDASLRLPADRQIATLLRNRSFAFSGQDRSGEDRIFAVVPIVPDTVYALATWNDEAAVAMRWGINMPAATFPLLMWLVTLSVAFFAINRLVIRHVRRLGRQMRRFALDRHLRTNPEKRTMVRELQDMEDDFLHMAEALIEDEARLEKTVQEKNILLKEVHHRVKNNLQLISSIMNLQMRRTQDPRTHAAMGRLQDRILSLATVHRNLYQTENLNNINAGELIRQIFNQLVSGTLQSGQKVDQSLSLEDITMVPEQAIPLTLAVSEMVTNAIKYLGTPPDAVPYIRVIFETTDDDMARLEVYNSTAPTSEDNSLETGLGSQLIKAFARQLGGTLHTSHEGQSYIVRIDFSVIKTAHEVADY
ncbi:sensor histidine kinase [Pseudaestuariivita rosea]|uniref:sensor histidine kinase n=1 Tax=Pseudaestuariivita rosea TaxID=2763263 RepID=UPI001ABA4316|nr:sensor histidine kinase [Pseudaestuariivita rosea]